MNKLNRSRLHRIQNRSHGFGFSPNPFDRRIVERTFETAEVEVDDLAHVVMVRGNPGRATCDGHDNDSEPWGTQRAGPARYISICAPSSMIWFVGSEKYCAALDELRIIEAKSFSRQRAMPGRFVATSVSRPRK